MPGGHRRARPPPPRPCWWSTTPAGPRWPPSRWHVVAPADHRLVRSEVNTGPAGGYHAGLGRVPRLRLSATPGCSTTTCGPTPVPRAAVGGGRQGAGDRVRVPGSRQADGAYGHLAVVVRVPRRPRRSSTRSGCPMEELFWWAEDTEYLQWRIPEAGYPRQVVDGALVDHDAIRQGDGVPLWKYYYEARNMLYVNLHVKRRIGHYPRNLSKLWPGPSCGRSTAGCAGWRSSPAAWWTEPGQAWHPLSGRADARTLHHTRRRGADGLSAPTPGGRCPRSAPAAGPGWPPAPRIEVGELALLCGTGIHRRPSAAHPDPMAQPERAVVGVTSSQEGLVWA